MKKHLSSAPSIRVRRRRGHAPSERKTAIAAILVICAVIIAVSAALCCKAGFPACSAQRTPPRRTHSCRRQLYFDGSSAPNGNSAPNVSSAPDGNSRTVYFRFRKRFRCGGGSACTRKF